MSKLKAPLFSFQAKGTLGNKTIFQTRHRTHIAKRYARTPNPKTPAQLTRRSWFTECIAAWHQLTPAEKQEYAQVNPRIGANPGYLNFMKEWLMGTVPNHPEDHELGGKGEISLQGLAGHPLGHCQANAPLGILPNQILNTPGTRWTMPGWFYLLRGVRPIATGYLIYTPIFVSKPVTFLYIGIDVFTLAVGTARLGIYNWDAGLPGSLLLDAGTVSVATIGNKAISISQPLTRGYYFTAIVCDINPTLTCPHADRAVMPPVPGSFYNISVLSYVALVTAGQAGSVAGGLPDPAPAPVSGLPSFNAHVFLRDQ